MPCLVSIDIFIMISATRRAAFKTNVFVVDRKTNASHYYPESTRF